MWDLQEGQQRGGTSGGPDLGVREVLHPQGDPVAPVAQLMITGLPLWLLYGCLKAYQAYCRWQGDKTRQPETETKYELVSGSPAPAPAPAAEKGQQL